jgi:hypothetical protein
MKPKRPTAKELGKLKARIKRLAPEQRRKLRELRTNIWWWRRGEIRHAFKNPHEKTRFSFSFEGTAEEVARNYELMRRSSNGEMFKENYLELRRTERTVAYTLWGAQFEPPYRQIFDPNKKPALLGWTDSPHRIEWNLFLDDKTLERAFLEYINQHRNVQGISPPHPLKGEKYRGVSWNYIEILDCIKFGIVTKPNGSQRSAASVARRLAEKFFDAYNEAISARENNPNPLWAFSEPGDFDETVHF